MRGTDKVRLGTLRRRLQHDSIIGDINWIPIEVGRGKRYTADERIQNFLEQTASSLLPSGVLQSSSSVGPQLRVDLLAPSDAPVDVGGRPTTRPPEAAVDATAAAAAAAGAAAAATGFERPHCWSALPQRQLRVRPYRRRRPQPVAAKEEVENQHNHPPLFLLSLFSSDRNLACRSVHTCQGFALSEFIFDHSLNSVHPGIAWAKHALSISCL